MTLPRRATEAMHWQIGEQEMARRAGVVAFSLSNNQVHAAFVSASPIAHETHECHPEDGRRLSFNVRATAASRAG
jgi:hypothetical protein